MFRESDPQTEMFSPRNLYLNAVGEDSFYGFLALNGHRLFHDQQFKEMYCDDNGRPCVPPGLMTVALLLRAFEKCSFEEAAAKAHFDIRWKVALDIGIDDRPFSAATLCRHQARIHLNEKTEQIFRTSIEEAKRVGLLSGKKIKIALDTTPIFGRGAVKDTYNLLADGIRQLCRAMAAVLKEKPEEIAARHDLTRYWTATSIKGDAQVDWSDDAERRVFLNSLVSDAERVLLAAKKLMKRTDDESLKRAADLLKKLVSQDTEPDPDEPETTRIKEGATSDRVVSTSDPEMRPGRKSASNKFQGHKAAIAVEPNSQIITALEVHPGNAPDATEALALVKATEANTGAVVEKAIADCAYGSAATRREFKDAGRELSAKLPQPKNPFDKSRFIIDLTNKIVTCPRGESTSNWNWVTRDKKPCIKFLFPDDVCSKCPDKDSCVKSKKGLGRTVTLHPEEALLEEAREYQQTPEFREDTVDRQVVEHRLARLTQLDIRQSRYYGRAKTKQQCLLAATVANLTITASRKRVA